MCAETLSCQANATLVQSPMTSGSYDLSAPSSTMIPEPKVMGCDIDVPFGAGHSTVSHSLHVAQLWTSTLTVIYSKKKSFSDKD